MTEKKTSKFEIGQKVIGYGVPSKMRNGIKGRILSKMDDGPLWEVETSKGDLWVFHEKQLRILKPKKKKEIWVNSYPTRVGSQCYETKEEAAKCASHEGVQVKFVLAKDQS